MKQTQWQVALMDIIMSLSKVADMISPVLAEHQKRVAYIGVSLAQQMGLSRQQQANVLAAGALHDIGGLSLTERLAALEFEKEHLNLHARIGAALLQSFQPLSDLAPIILHHHTYWNSPAAAAAPIEAQIVHLADRVDVLIDYRADACVLVQVDKVCRQVQAEKGRMFNPLLVEALLELAPKEAFWLDLTNPMLDQALAAKKLSTITLDSETLLELAHLVGYIVDYRSRFTATHSAGVAASAATLGHLAGMSEEKCNWLRSAGYLHDLGKLAIPAEILEKPGPLTAAERARMRSHAYHTYHSIAELPGLETLAGWAGYHHERLDGSGYPFHLSASQLSYEARIMAVADVHSALREDRPYRSGLSRAAAEKLLLEMAKTQALDGDVVQCLLQNFAVVETARRAAQDKAWQHYEAFGNQSRLILILAPG